MSAVLFSLVIGFGQGLLHAAGPDHCAAMATLGSVDCRRRTAIGAALRFAFGHAVVLAGFATVCLGLGVGLSETVERWAEVLGGGVLVALAAAALFFPTSVSHGHPHLPGHDADHRHARIGAAAGALMAFSGVRSLLFSLPPLLVGGRFSLEAWTYLPGFGLGVFAGMAVFGLVVAHGLGRIRERHAPALRRFIAASSGVLGLVWMVSQ